MKKIIVPVISFAVIISFLMSSCSVFGNERKHLPSSTDESDYIEDTIATTTEATSDSSESSAETETSETTEATTTTTTTEATTTTTETTVNPFESLGGEYKLFAAKYNESFTGEEFAWATKYTFDIASYPDAKASSIWLDPSGACVMTTTVKEEKSELALTLQAGAEGITAASADGTVTGSLKDGIFELNTPDGVMYFAQEGKDTSSVKTTQYKKALISEGNSYYYGTAESGCDLKKAESLYKLLEKENDIYGSYALGRLWADNRFTNTEHYKKAIEYYDKCIKADYPLGYYGMGRLYLTGSLYATGVKKDLVKAKEYLDKAYEKGRMEAAVCLGYMYENGLTDGAEGSDGITALKYYDEAAKSDSPYIRGLANNALGSLYLFGTTGVDKDTNKAIACFEQADNDGNKEAPASLAYIYLNGIGADKDEAKAAEYIEKAVKRGSGSGCVYLYDCYYNGIGGVDKDESKLDDLAKKAAEFGSVRGLELLGNNRYFATGAKEDFKEAGKYYRMAYKENSAYACGKLSYMSYYGKGIKKDKKEVFNYAKAGDERGELYATYMMGYCYTFGVGTKKSPKKALDKLSIYLKNGSDDKLKDDCKDMLKSLVKSGKLKQKDVDKALK